MKRKAFALLIVLACTMTACGQIGETVADSDSSKEMEVIQQESIADTLSDVGNMDTTENVENGSNVEVPKEYENLIKSYETALSESWDGGKLMDNDLNFMMADCYGSNPFKQIGYWVGDIDGDGVSEFVVGAISAGADDFYGKLIFDCYTLDVNGSCVKVFGSEERNRYYYAGGNMFVNIGSSGAADSFETVVKYESGELNVNSSIAVPSEYVQMDFQTFEGNANVTDIPEEQVNSIGDTTALEMPILDEINQNVTIGTTGAYMTAVQSAVKLLDWAAGTGLDQEEIKAATVAWLMDKGNDEQAFFAAKLEQVDLAYQKLLTDEAVDTYTSAGCNPESYPWGADATEIVEIIMEVVGLR